MCERLPEGLGPCPLDAESVTYVLGTLPKQVLVNPLEAEVIGADYLLTILRQMPAGAGFWAEQLRGYARCGYAVLRPVLVKTSQYADHLSKIRDWDGQVVAPTFAGRLRKAITEQFLWMVEISVPHLYSANRRKVGEILVYAEEPVRPVRDMESFVMARVVGNLVLYKEGPPSRPTYEFLPLGCEGHVELFGCEDTR
jgi:hypothetical protein